MKKIKYVVLLLSFLLLMSGCVKKQEEDLHQSSSTPLLLEVTKNDSSNKMYLFGSIHAAEDTMYPLPDYIVNAYNDSDVVAVEFDLIEYQNNIDNQSEQLMKFLNPNGKLITDYVDDETYKRAVDIIENVTIFNNLYDYYNPVMWQMLIENAMMLEADLFSNLGIDNHFLELAKKDKKDILELESAEFQYNLFSDFETNMQVYLLKQAVDGYSDALANLKELYKLYKKGNKNDLEKIIFDFDEDANEYDVQYNDKIITKRNKTMFDLLEKNYKDGKEIFCTVGLAHIIGNDGISALFEKNGYTVRIVN